jgi:hypothetical protein
MMTCLPFAGRRCSSTLSFDSRIIDKALEEDPQRYGAEYFFEWRRRSLQLHRPCIARRGTLPLSMIMNRMWPRAVTAQIRLIPWRAPVAWTIGVSPFAPQVRPA